MERFPETSYSDSPQRRGQMRGTERHRHEARQSYKETPRETEAERDPGDTGGRELGTKRKRWGRPWRARKEMEIGERFREEKVRETSDGRRGAGIPTRPAPENAAS